MAPEDLLISLRTGSQRGLKKNGSLFAGKRLVVGANCLEKGPTDNNW